MTSVLFTPGRYFVLYNDGKLKYYDSRAKGEEKGSLGRCTRVARCRREPAGTAGEALAYRFRQPDHLGSAGFARGLDARELGAGAALFLAALEAVSKMACGVVRRDPRFALA